MPFEVTPDPNEEVLLLRQFQVKNGDPFAVAVSNFAIYLPAKKFFAKKDPWYFRKVPLSDVRRVSLDSPKPIYLYLFAAFMVLGGAIGLYLLIGEADSKQGHESARAIGYSAALVVVGLILPFFAKGRRILVVKMINETYKWKQQFIVDRASRKEIEKLQNEILEACRRVGIPTTDPIH